MPPEGLYNKVSTGAGPAVSTAEQSQLGLVESHVLLDLLILQGKWIVTDCNPESPTDRHFSGMFSSGFSILI